MLIKFLAADVTRRGPPVAPCAHAAAPPSKKTQALQALLWEISHHISIAKLEADSLIAGEGVVVAVVGGALNYEHVHKNSLQDET